MIFVPGWALNGHIEPRPGWKLAVWVDVIVPILFVLFLTPGLAYGIAVGSIKNDRYVARMMNETMKSMGSYIVLAFFAGQFVAWFGHSNLGKVIALARMDVTHADEGTAVEVGQLDGMQKRLKATVVRFPHFDPTKERVKGNYG